MPTLVKAKTGIYYVVFSKKGKRIWRSTRTRDKKQAFRILTDTDPSQSSAFYLSNTVKSLADCVDDYLAYVKTNHSKKSHQLYSCIIKRFRDFFLDAEIKSITPFDIEKYKIERSNNASPTSVNIDLKTIRAFFNCLKKWKMVAENPCVEVKFMRIPAVIPAYLNEDTLQTMVAKINDLWLKNIVLFAAMTGVRLGEVTNLRWEDIDLENRTALIHSSLSYQVKGGKIRKLPLNDTVLTVLNSMPQNTGYVFAGKRGERANPNFVSKSFRMVVRNGGFDPRLHFHSLRHSFASILVKKGVSLYQVQRLLGHSSPRVTEIYAHLQNGEMHDVVNKLAV